MRFHVQGSLLNALHDAHQIDVEHPPPVGDRDFQKRREGARNAGVGKHELEASVAGHRRFDEANDRGFVGHVDGGRPRDAVSVADPLRGVVHGLVEVGDHDGGALPGEGERGGAADAARGARHDRAFVFQSGLVIHDSKIRQLWSAPSSPKRTGMTS